MTCPCGKHTFGACGCGVCPHCGTRSSCRSGMIPPARPDAHPPATPTFVPARTDTPPRTGDAVYRVVTRGVGLYRVVEVVSGTLIVAGPEVAAVLDGRAVEFWPVGELTANQDEARKAAQALREEA